MKELQNVLKANEIMIDKLNELKNYFDNLPLCSEKEAIKYSKIYESESAKEYKQKYLKASKDFNDRLYLEVKKLNDDNYKSLVKKLVNNFAKVEDEYFMLISASKSDEMTASLMFKCECKLNYLLENLNSVNQNVNLVNTNDKSLEI